MAMELSALVVAGGYSAIPGTRCYRFTPEFIWGMAGLIAVTVGGNIMRTTLAVAVGFCLAFPLSAGAASGACTPGAQATCAQAVNSDFSAARRHRIVSICPPGPPLTRDVCLCEIHGGWPQTYRPIFCFGKPCPGVVVCWPGENRQ